jgi:hypothetical protein
MGISLYLKWMQASLQPFPSNGCTASCWRRTQPANCHFVCSTPASFILIIGGIDSSPIDVDLTNESLLALWQAIPPRKAADLAISSAEALDHELEAIPAELISAMEGIGEKSKLYRSVHRKMHIDQIEEVLKNKGNK